MHTTRLLVIKLFFWLTVACCFSPAATAQVPPQGSGTAATDAADGKIADRLRTIFAKLRGMNEVRVEVTAGVVTLKGEVPSIEAAEKAELIAGKIAGVVVVGNELETTLELGKRLTPSAKEMFGQLRRLVSALPLLAVALTVVLCFWWLGRLLARFDFLYRRLTDNKLIQGILRQVVKTGLILFGIFVALELLGATALVGAVLGTAGVVGLAVGFAFRDIVENYLASIILSVRQPFNAKDFVQLGDKLGTVVRLTMRDTVLMTPDGNHLMIPNSAVFKGQILNMTRNPLRRFDLAIGVGTDVDLVQAQQLGCEVLEEMAGVVDDPEPYARVQALGDSTVSIHFYGWIDQTSASFGKVKSEAVRLIKAIMDQHNIDMPVPTYQVTMQKPAEAPAPQRGALSVTEQAHLVDVAPDHDIEEQVDKERRESGEEDLLEDVAPTDPQQEVDTAAQTN